MKLFDSHGHVHALMLLAIILVASSFPVGSAIANELPPAVMMFIRFLMAALMFLPIVIAKYGLILPTTNSLLRYIFLSAPLVAFFWCMFEGLRYTSVLNTGALYTLVPAITATCAFIINKERTGLLRMSGLLLGTFGALWIVFRGSLASFVGLDLNYGDLVFLAGCLFMGMYSPFFKRFYDGEPMLVMTFWILLSGSAWLLFLSITSITHVDWANVKSDVYLGVVYLSLFSTLITFFIMNYSTVRIGATKVSAYSLLTPLFVISMSILVGIDSFELIILPGIIFILAALIFIQRDDKHISTEIEKERYNVCD